MNPERQISLFDGSPGFPETDTSPVHPRLGFESRLWQRGILRVAGVDEAGRGCLAGPVVAAAVILPVGCELPGVQDSKKMSAAAREEARERILAQALATGIGLCSPSEIDRLNILHAAMEAMRRAVLNLNPGPDHLLVDGNRCFPDSPWPFQTVIKGDDRSLSIGAASVLAKTHRDAIMQELDTQNPGYGWASNKGYPTASHYDAIRALGQTVHHRSSFRLS